MVELKLRPLYLLILFAVLVESARGGKGEFCRLGGQRYRMGQTWHPTLMPFGENHCINCTCHRGGEVKCVTLKDDCPRPDCEEPKILEGECCPSCDDFDNVPPTAERRGGETQASREPGCTWDNLPRQNGDMFPSNTTGLSRNYHNQCVLCVCLMGKVLCHLKTCLPTKCKKFKGRDNDCCPICADEVKTEPALPPLVLSDPKEDNFTSADCSFTEGYHKNGSSWNPVIKTVGVYPCIVCSCLNGNVKCSRPNCPPNETGSCEGPERACCKQCLPRPAGDDLDLDSRPGSRGARPSRGEDSKRRRKKERGRKRKCKGRKKCRDGKKKRKKGNRKRKNKGRGRRVCREADKTEVHVTRKANATKISDVIMELCLPRHTDRLVYRGKGDNYEMMAFDFLDGTSVEMLRWKFPDGKLHEDTERQLVEAAEFRRDVTCDQIVGATNKRGFKKMLKKLESKMKRCKLRRRPCASKSLDKIIRRDRRLKALPTGRVCGK